MEREREREREGERERERGGEGKRQRDGRWVQGGERGWSSICRIGPIREDHHHRGSSSTVSTDIRYSTPIFDVDSVDLRHLDDHDVVARARERGSADARRSARPLASAAFRVAVGSEPSEFRRPMAWAIAMDRDGIAPAQKCGDVWRLRATVRRPSYGILLAYILKMRAQKRVL